MGDVLCVLVVAAGAAWESAVVQRLGDGDGVTVLKRCVDVDDLLATATTGQAQAAVVALDAPGLDSRAVDHLARHGVRPVGVHAVGAETGRLHAARIGVPSVVAADDLDGLLAALLEAPDGTDPDDTRERPADDAGPHPAADLPDPDGPAPVGGGRVVAVWGPQGAPGRTTVACGLAGELARRGRRTVLVDADPWGGSVAQQLGVLDEVSGILSASRLAATGALAERLPGVLRGLGDGLSVVTGLPRADRYVEVRPGAVEHLLEVAREGADVVVDTGFSLEDDPGAEFGGRPGRNSMTLGALSVADEVVVVGSADPVGLSRLARALVELREPLGGAPVRVVVNRNRPTLGWSEKDIAGMVEGFAHLAGLHFLPEDRAAVDAALVSGRSPAEVGDGPLVRALAAVADGLLGEPGRPARRGRPGRRLRRRTAGTARPR